MPHALRFFLIGWLILLAGAVWAQAPTISSFTPTSGPANTTVTVTGTNLTNIKSVVLRGISCNITPISATSASFKVPAQASTGKFRLTTTGGNVLSASDFTVTRASNSLTYVLRTGNFNSISVGTFSTPAFTDLDHDGLIDLLVGQEINGSVSHYEQSSANSTSFTLRSANLSGLTGHYNSLVSVTDIDGDGLLELVVGTGAGNFKHYEQTAMNGTTFTQLSNDFNNVFSTGGTTYQIPHFTDIDGDGLLDLLVGDEFLSRYEQTAANGGTFSQLNNQNFGPTADAGNGGSATCVVDLDGDNLLDMLIGRGNGQIFHYEQNSANSTAFTQVTPAFSGLNSATYTTPAITDLDGDGLLDMLVGGFDGNLRHYEQVGTPSITSFTPTSGPVGTSITITGTNLDGATAARVNGTAGTITGTPTSTSLTFTVGAGSTTGAVSVVTPGGTATGATFTVTAPAPTITSFTPTSGPTGTSVTITGTNLTGATAARVNGTNGTIVGTPTSTSLTFTVGAGSTTGAVSVVTPGGTATGSTFTVIQPPTITSFTPTSGPVGTSVTITGTNLTGATAARVNGTAGTIVGTPTSTSLTFTVGAGSTTGAVSVVTPGGTATGSTFTVTTPAPTITSFTPTSGPVGTSVTITGTNLNGATAARVNGTAGTIVGTPTATTLTFTVGAGSTSGAVSVVTPGGTATGSTFTITAAAPTITSFGPNTGPVGTSVTITGTDLATTTSVRVNGVTGAIVGTPTATSLTFIVPGTATTGLISLTTPLGTATSATNFTVTSAGVQCSGATPLATSYVSNNSNKGEMFDIIATNTVTISCFDVNLILGSNGNYEIYYKTGSYVGSENNAAAWTLLGSNPNVPCLGFDVPSPMLIPINVTIPAGQTAAFYITATDVANTTGIRYTNNSGITILATSPDLSIRSGIGKAYPFSTNYVNRSFNGTVRYFVGAPPTITSFTPTSGPVGTSVTVTGTNLSTATAVAVNGTAGTIVGTPTATSLTFTVAAGSTTGAVSVTTLGGTATGSTFTVTTPSPTITSFTPTSGPVGTSVTVTGTNLNGATAARVNGTAGTIVGTPTSTSLTFTVGVGSTTGAVSVTTPGGTATGSTFTVIPAPTITSFTPTSGAIGTSVTITGTNLTGATAARVNGTAGTITANTATSVTFTVGAGSTTGAVSVTTAGGTATGTTFTVTFAPTITSFTPTSGPVGTSVTITGTGLGGATAARVNGTAGTIGANTATSLTFTVGAGSTTGAVSVTTPGGTATGSTFTVTVPTVTSVSAPASNTYGIGNNLNFSVAFSQNVTVNTGGGTPTLPLTVGSTARTATYVSGSGSSTLVFRYTVPVGDLDTDGVALGGSISLNGGTIRNTGGDNALLTLNGVASTAGVLVDGVVPTVVISSAAGPSGSTTSTSPLTVTFTFSEPVSGFFNSDIAVTNGTKSGFNILNSSTFIVNITPTGTPPVLVTINVAAGAARDAGVNDNTAATYTFTYLPGPTITSFTPTSGPVGTSVTITGTNLTGTTNVAVNGTAGTIVGTPTATSVTFTVGAGSSTGAVSVTAPAGTATGSTFTVTGAPTALALSPQTVAENTGANAVVGTFSTTDPDVGNTFTYTLVTGTGSTDNGLVNISGSQLRITASPNFEARSSYAIRVRTTDNTSLFTEQAFTISVTDVNEAPTALGLSPQNVDENTGTNAVVGTFSTTDPDAANTFTYSLVTGTGSTDNGLVNISSNQLRITASPDFETKPSYAIRVRTTDQGGLFTEQSFTITINDLSEGPGISSFAPALGPEGTVVTLIGADFSGTTGVSFNGTSAASFTVLSATQLRATVPVGATTGLITVTTGTGSDQTATGFEVLPIFTGTFNSCLSITPVTSTGSGEWLWLRASNGALVAALNDQGHALGTVSADFYLNQGAIRRDTQGREYFDRNWHLNAQNAFTGQQVRVRFYGRNAEFSTYVAANDGDGNDATTLSQLRLTQYQGANEDCQLANNASGAAADYRLLTPGAPEALGGANWFALETLIDDHFSEFFLNGGNQPLPVELVAFGAERTAARVVQLTWRTASERQNRGFVVEQSGDGRKFTAISELIAGQGTTLAAHTYAFRDAAAPSSLVYYRLRQLDADGQVNYSGIIAVRALATAAAWQVYPNPVGAARQLTLSGVATGEAVEVLDATGRVVRRWIISQSETDVSLAELPTGVYMLRSHNQQQRLLLE